MSATNGTNWADRGISWSEEEVSRQFGEHATDRRVIGKAQIPVVFDLDKFREFYGDSCVLGIMDGTSIRVMAQDVSRTGISKKLSTDEIRSRIDLRLRGIRNRALVTAPVTVTVYTLPGGKTWQGTDEAAYQAEYASALVDLGTPADVALTIATSMTLAK